MTISIGKNDYNVIWGKREVTIALYPPHIPKIKAHYKESYREIETSCVIHSTKEVKTQVAITFHNGSTICSPRDQYNEAKGFRVSFVRALNNMLANEFPGTRITDERIRRGIKQDVFENIYKDGFNKILGI